MGPVLAVGGRAGAREGDAMTVEVRRVDPSDVYPIMRDRHYARRVCSVSFAFGLFDGDRCRGVVTFGVPCMQPLREVCGPAWSAQVLELNRLVCDSDKNIASQLVGGALRLLPRPSVVISFADIGQGHVGFVYQASNFAYYGLSAKRTDWALKGREHLHGATIGHMSRGHADRVGFMRSKFGDDFYLKPRSLKHRYVFFCGSKREKLTMRAAFKYPFFPYPKGVCTRYEIDQSALRVAPLVEQLSLFGGRR